MPTIVKQTLAKKATEKELDKTFEQMKALLDYTQDHIEKTDKVISITVSNETHTLIIQPNKD